MFKGNITRIVREKRLERMLSEETDRSTSLLPTI
jgi:hypothetical protein